MTNKEAIALKKDLKRIESGETKFTINLCSMVNTTFGNDCDCPLREPRICVNANSGLWVKFCSIFNYTYSDSTYSDSTPDIAPATAFLNGCYALLASEGK
jgi:hypothetical protein